MLRPVSLLPALVAAVCLGGVAGLGALAPPAQAAQAGKAAQAAPARAEEDTPLTVTVDSLGPTEIPRRGPIRVSGTLTNRDDQTWTSVNLYAFVSDAPMTTQAELDAAAEVAPTDPVGERIVDPGTYSTVEEIAPGETVTYAFTVPRSSVAAVSAGVAAEQPGVYWFGVHALGSNDAGGDTFADGRARTFMPLIEHDTEKSVDTAMVIPVRRQIAHAPDGSISRLPRWTEALGEDGALGSLVDFGATAGSRAVTWLVDPAVVDAVRRLAAGNPPRSLAPTIDPDNPDAPDEEPGDGESESSSASPADDTGEGGDGDGGADGDGGEAEEPLDPRTAAAADAAAAWLDRLHQALEGQEILALPYGDVDVAAAAEHDPDAYRDARKRSSGALQPWGLATTAAVAPPSGYLSPAALRLAEPGATILASDRAFRGRAPAVATTEGRRVVVTSAGAVRGGPGPDDPLTTVALRQRIAAEAALRLLRPGQPPLVVSFPSSWSPQVDSAFFAGLDDLDWLNLTSVASAADVPGTAVPVDRIDYPEEQLDLELDVAAFAAADELVRAGETLQNLLTLNDEVAGVVRDEAFTDLSYSFRLNPLAAAASASSSRLWIEGRLQSVRIDAPKAVILSSGSGRFSATVTNGLDQPVSVRIQATADAPLTVTVPDETIELGPGNRSNVLLSSSSSAVGIRNLTLVLTDTDGVPIGSSDDLPIRANRVSNVIWLIVGTGIALLLGAIAVRLFRRVRAARRAG